MCRVLGDLCTVYARQQTHFEKKTYIHFAHRTSLPFTHRLTPVYNLHSSLWRLHAGALLQQVLLQCMRSCYQSIIQSLFESGKSPYTNTHTHTHTCTKHNHNIHRICSPFHSDSADDSFYFSKKNSYIYSKFRLPPLNHCYRMTG